MKRWRNVFITILTFAMCLSFSQIKAYAADGYTYTVTFYAGNQGSFTDSSGLSVEGGSGKISVKKDRITVTGLNAGDIVSFDAQAGAVKLKESGKYYVKGIRGSGRDNSTVASSAFRVTGDADYVAAYGIQGDTVAYTVNYQDESGNTLAASNTYYGNIGDKPIVAYRYIEGYTPNFLAITKTLQADESKNVFTFVYVKDTTEAPQQPTQPQGTNPPTATNPAGTNPAGTAPAGNTTTAGTAGGTATNNAANTDNTAVDTADDGADDTVDTANDNADDLQEVGDDDTPLADQDLLDLDDEETPLANQDLSQMDVETGLPLAAYIGMGVGAAAALAVLFVVLRKRRKPAKVKDKKES